MNDILISQPLLSLCMIVKNEEKVLGKCLKSVEDIVGEIVVIDTGSDDSTIQIAQSYNAKISHFNWINDYSAARNEALKIASGRWILYLDADEELTESSKSKILDYINLAPDNCGGFIVSIESPYYDDNGKLVEFTGKYPRIFRNILYPKLHFFGRVHEQIAPSLIENGYFFMPSDLIISHGGYAIPKNGMQNKVKRNLDYLSEHVQEEPQNGYAWYQLGNTLAQMNLNEQALEALSNALTCKNLTNFLSANTALVIAQILFKANNFNNVIDWCDKALSFLPDHIPAINMKGLAQLRNNEPENAKVNFELVYQLIKMGKSPGFEMEIPESDLLANINKAQRQILLKSII